MNDRRSIEFSQVSKAFGETQALSRISFQINLSPPESPGGPTDGSNSGTIVSIWGANGAGKSTLLSLVGGLTRPTSGKISVFGCRPAERDFLSIVRPGYLLQQTLLYGDLSVGTNLALFRDLTGSDQNYIDSLCRRFELGPVVNRPVRECSPGMIKRVSIVRALIHRPQLILFDEPFAAIDWQVQDSIVELLRELRSEGRTIFIATHRFDAVQRLADRVLVLDQGELVQDLNLEGLSRDSLTIDRLCRSRKGSKLPAGGRTDESSGESSGEFSGGAR